MTAIRLMNKSQTEIKHKRLVKSGITDIKELT